MFWLEKKHTQFHPDKIRKSRDYNLLISNINVKRLQFSN